MANRQKHNPLWKIILTDIAGVLCLLIVPFLGPVPGPGGIPLLLAGLGLLALNHDWADNAITYVKKHSSSMREILFPDKRMISWLWDIAAAILFFGSILINVYTTFWLLKGIGIGMMSTALAIFIMNRRRIEKLARVYKRFGKR